MKLFAKFFPPRQIDHVRREIIGYKALKSLQGSTIPFCYGTYNCEQYDGTIVLLEDVSTLGTPLHLFEGEKTEAQFREASLALKSIHALDIAHGDSSHGNILITATGVIIIDFERAKYAPLRVILRSTNLSLGGNPSRAHSEEMVTFCTRASSSMDGPKNH